MGWETTIDDILTVLNTHGVSMTDEQLTEIHDGLDHDLIEENVMYYTNMDDQTSSMLSDIEDYLIEEKIILAEKKFLNP